MEDEIIEFIKKNIPEDYLNWQITLLNTITCSNNYDSEVEDFQKSDIDYENLYKRLDKKWKEYQTTQLINTCVIKESVVSKYNLKLTKTQYDHSMEAIQDIYSKDVTKKIMEFIRLISDHDHKRNIKGNIFQNFTEMNHFLEKTFKDNTMELIDKEEELRINEIKKSNKQKKEKIEEIKMVKLGQCKFLQIESISFPLQILLFTCLSKSNIWPRLMKNNTMTKNNQILFLSRWFRGFSHKFDKFIPCDNDIWTMNKKGIRKLRDKLRSLKFSNQRYFEMAKNNELSLLRQAFMDGKDVNMRDGDHNLKSLLHIASEDGNYELIDLLEQFNINQNIQNAHGQTALFYAVGRRTDPGLTERVLNLKADPNIRDRDQSTALYWGVYWSSLEVLKALERHGAKLHVYNHIGRTPLIKSAYLNRPNIVKWLLGFDEIKQNINFSDNKGRTAVHACCWGPKGGRYGKVQNGVAVSDSGASLELLLNAGAEVYSFYLATPFR